MFGLFKKKDNKEVLGAHMQGEAIESARIPDAVFAEEMLGQGMAIIPSDGKVYAPCDATVESVFDTKHAVTLKTAKGTEILIHVGMDTVSLNGAPFQVYTTVGAKVAKGALLLEADLEAIKAAGLSAITPMVICNSDDKQSIKRMVGKSVNAGDPVMEVE